MISAGIISKLTHNQRTVLFGHIDSPQALDLHSQNRLTIRMLLREGLLRGHPAGVHFPKFTELTEAGRDCVARLLAEYAETLIAAGCLEGDGCSPQERPLRMLAQLRAVRSARRLLPHETYEVSESKELDELLNLGPSERPLDPADR